jgi:hypothetical protein
VRLLERSAAQLLPPGDDRHHINQQKHPISAGRPGQVTGRHTTDCAAQRTASQRACRAPGSTGSAAAAAAAALARSHDAGSRLQCWRLQL